MGKYSQKEFIYETKNILIYGGKIITKKVYVSMGLNLSVVASLLFNIFVLFLKRELPV